MEALARRGGPDDAASEDLDQTIEIVRSGDRHSDRVCCRSHAPQQAGQHATGPQLDEGLHALAQEGVEALVPADRAAQLGRQQLRPLLGIVMEAGVHVGHDDRVECMEVRGREGLAEPVTCT